MAEAVAEGSSRQVQKTLYSLDSPFPKVQWPEVTPENQATIEELLCSLLKPLGDYRRSHASNTKARQSQGQKRKSKGTASDDLGVAIDATFAEGRPPIAPHVIVGFNATTRYLSQYMQSDRADAAASLNTGQPVFPAAVFVDTDALAPVLYSHFPLLCKHVSRLHESASEVRLVKLPAAAAQRLALSLGIHQAGLILVLEGAPDSRPLLEFVRHHVNPVEIPWIEEVPKGKYLAVQIRAVQTTASVKEPEQKKG